MGVSEEARHLLSAATKDLRALKGMGDSSIFVDEIYGFHAQQTVEKALKSWLSLLGIEYPKTHDISLLLSMLNAHDQSVNYFYDLIDLNPCTVQFRYEAFDEIGEPLNREAVLIRLDELVQKIETLINTTSI